MITFTFLTVFIGLLATVSFLWAVLKIGDVFHPLAYLMPMVFFLYVFLPVELMQENIFPFSAFTVAELTKVQAFNAACVFGLIAGALRGGRLRSQPRNVLTDLSPWQVRRVFTLAIVLGVISLAAFAINVNNVGGLYEAYSQEKGGGTAESGYVRDAVFWSMSALAALTACIRYDRVRTTYIFTGIVLMIPLFVHGLFAGRRGPTFIVFSSLAAAYYLGRNKRPALVTFVSCGMLLGMLLLLMVTFRDQFRLGAGVFRSPAAALGMMVDQLETERSENVERTLEANEFIYGVDVVTRFNAKADAFYWGKRILAVMFIRPIPSQLWPTKYQDVGMERYLINVGLGGVDQYSAVANGAAPGFAADLFAEFSWGAIAASFLIGWGYGRVWKNALRLGGIWLVLYVLFIGLSIFFVVQTLEAILYRLLFTALPLILFWRIMVRRKETLASSRSLPVVSVEACGR